MIVLDTNVVSELMRAAPAPSVLGWFASFRASELWITAITAAELRFGAGRLPSGRRRDQITAAVEGLLEADFRGRVLPFDAAASVSYADLVVARERSGRPLAFPDAQIAAIAVTRGAALATHNVRDFADLGLSLINPWEPT